MKGIVTEYNMTGVCIIDVQKTCKMWNNQFGISRYHDKFTLFINGKRKGTTNLKVVISKEQATELITELSLVNIKDSTFRNASLYISKEFAKIEYERLSTVLKEKEQEYEFVLGIVKNYGESIR